MKTRVLVTGANGQLGQTIKEIYGSDPDIDFIFVTKAELDLTKEIDVTTFFNANKFNYCINCAAYTNVELAETNSEEAFSVNSTGVKNLALQCKTNNITLIHISTDYVFDGKKKTPYTEADVPCPINEYGKSKLAGERIVQDLLDSYFIIRTSWLYSKFGHNFLKTIVQKVKNKEQMQIINSQTGAPTSCSDLAELIFFLMKSKLTDYGIYNFSADGKTTWYKYALHICSHFKSYDCNSIEPINVYNFKANRPDYSVLDNGKIKKIFPKTFMWRESVDRTIQELVKP